MNTQNKQAIKRFTHICLSLVSITVSAEVHASCCFLRDDSGVLHSHASASGLRQKMQKDNEEADEDTKALLKAGVDFLVGKVTPKMQKDEEKSFWGTLKKKFF